LLDFERTNLLIKNHAGQWLWREWRVVASDRSRFEYSHPFSNYNFKKDKKQTKNLLNNNIVLIFEYPNKYRSTGALCESKPRFN